MLLIKNEDVRKGGGVGGGTDTGEKRGERERKTDRERQRQRGCGVTLKDDSGEINTIGVVLVELDIWTFPLHYVHA